MVREGGQPLGPRRIRAPLTLVGAPARIRKGDPRGRHRGTIMGQPNGWPTVVNSPPPLGAQRTTGVEMGPAGPRDIEVDSRPRGHPTPASRRLDGERRPAGDIRSVSEGNCRVRTRGVQEPVATALSPLAESFKPRPISEEQQPR